jgi:hypothetical protein
MRAAAVLGHKGNKRGKKVEKRIPEKKGKHRGMTIGMEWNWGMALLGEFAVGCNVRKGVNGREELLLLLLAEECGEVAARC